MCQRRHFVCLGVSWGFHTEVKTGSLWLRRRGTNMQTGVYTALRERVFMVYSAFHFHTLHFCSQQPRSSCQAWPGCAVSPGNAFGALGTSPGGSPTLTLSLAAPLAASPSSPLLPSGWCCWNSHSTIVCVLSHSVVSDTLWSHGL